MNLFKRPSMGASITEVILMARMEADVRIASEIKHAWSEKSLYRLILVVNGAVAARTDYILEKEGAERTISKIEDEIESQKDPGS